jgi:hypothetical protein
MADMLKEIKAIITVAGRSDGSGIDNERSVGPFCVRILAGSPVVLITTLG